MSIKKTLLILLLPLMLINGLLGQKEEILITGRITDENGEPVTGAAVSLVNTVIGAYSDYDGNYRLKIDVPGDYRLKISHLGYETIFREISVQNTIVLDESLVSRFTRTEEVIVSATRAGERAPFTWSGISGDELRKSNLGQDLPFLIGLTPSLVETSEAGTGIGYTSFRIRGTDGSRINITMDGIPLNDAESQQVFWVDLPDLASSVDNIQVQRGVGTSSNGAGAFGASVNMQTKNPEREPFAEISTSAGSFNTFKNTITAGTGLISGKFAFQLRHSVLKSDGYIRRTGSDNDAISLSGIYKTDKSLVKINFMSGSERTGISWWGVPLEILETDRRYNPAGVYTDENGNTRFYDNETDNYRQNHIQMIWSRSISNSLSFHSALHYTMGEGYYEEYREDQAFSKYGLQPVFVSQTEQTTTDLIRRKWMKNDFYGIVYSLNYRKKRIEAIIGGGINNYLGDHFGRLVWMQYNEGTEKDHQWYFNDAVKGECSIYGKVSYKFNDKLTGFGDLQYRHIIYKMNGVDDDLKDITQSHRFNFLNPKAGIFISLTPSQDAYLSLSVAHREPTRANFKDAAGDPSATPRPETLYDTEAGYLFKTNRLRLGLNAFYMFYRDQLVPTGELSDVGYPIMTNVEKSFRRGIEITMDLKPLAAVSWNVSATMSSNKIPGYTEYYTDYNTSDWSSSYRSKYLGSVDIAYSPGLTGISDLSYALTDKMSFHFISKYVGKQYFDNTMSRARMLDPYFVSNLRVDLEPDIKMIRNTEIQILVNNIFNSLYESNAYGGNWYEDGRENSWSYYFPQAGINFMVRLGLRF
ncbi:MAG: TonB-dependent receptor [Bacteroidales bacterium]|nr:TonB-dependent receptor [Bacteroidales bacterium]